MKNDNYNKKIKKSRKNSKNWYIALISIILFCITLLSEFSPNIKTAIKKFKQKNDIVKNYYTNYFNQVFIDSKSSDVYKAYIIVYNNGTCDLYDEFVDQTIFQTSYNCRYKIKSTSLDFEYDIIGGTHIYRSYDVIKNGNLRLSKSDIIYYKISS